MPTIALVGDRSPSVRAHARIPQLIDALRRRDGVVLDPYWVPSTEAHENLDAFDGIWVVPGSPYESPEGAIQAARTARENNIPFLGTCGGFQHAILMLARDLAGIEDAAHAEYGGAATGGSEAWRGREESPAHAGLGRGREPRPGTQGAPRIG